METLPDLTLLAAAAGLAADVIFALLLWKIARIGRDVRAVSDKIDLHHAVKSPPPVVERFLAADHEQRWPYVEPVAYPPRACPECGRLSS